MTAKRRSLIRWSVRRIAEEFGVDRSGLRRALVRAGLRPGRDGRFSSHQVRRILATIDAGGRGRGADGTKAAQDDDWIAGL